MPQPGTAWKLELLPKLVCTFSMSLANCTMAEAMGCSLFCSAAPMMVSARARLHTWGGTSSVTRLVIGVPCVMVPVLSKTTVFTCRWRWNRLIRKEREITHSTHLVGIFQCGGSLDEHTIGGTRAGGNHDSCGRGQTQGTGTSNGQHA